MTRYYRDGDGILDRKIGDAEKRLDALYAKRAGRRNTMEGSEIQSWIFCACGRVNQSDGFPTCETCAWRARRP